MKLVVFAVLDTKAGAFLQPFFSLSRGVAIRQFTQAANDAGHDFCTFAGDFHLFEIGEFDQESGQLVPKPSVDLGTALQFQTVEFGARNGGAAEVMPNG